MGSGDRAGRSKSSGFVTTRRRADLPRDGEVTRVAQGKVSEHATVSGTIPFAGVDDHYLERGDYAGRR
jgi:hypothetical protein